MNFDEYRQHVRRTMPPSDERQILILTLGVVGELQEVFEAAGQQEDEELGDLLWYVTALELALSDVYTLPLFSLGIRDPDLFTEDLFRARVSSSRLAEAVKKLVGHQKLEKLSMVLKHLHDMRQLFASLEPERLVAIMTANVAKLQARYPEGFTCE